MCPQLLTCVMFIPSSSGFTVTSSTSSILPEVYTLDFCWKQVIRNILSSLSTDCSSWHKMHWTGSIAMVVSTVVQLGPNATGKAEQSPASDITPSIRSLLKQLLEIEAATRVTRADTKSLMDCYSHSIIMLHVKKYKKKRVSFRHNTKKTQKFWMIDCYSHFIYHVTC